MEENPTLAKSKNSKKLNILFYVLIALIVLSAGGVLFFWLARPQLMSTVPSVEENAPPFSMTTESGENLPAGEPVAFDPDGLPTAWPKIIPIFPSEFKVLNTFSVGETYGLVVGTNTSYEQVGQFYQTLADKFSNWSKNYTDESSGEEFVVYHYGNQKTGLNLRIVVYNEAKEGFATIYSLVYSNSPLDEP